MVNEKNKPDTSEVSNPWKDFQQIDEGDDIFKQIFKYAVIPIIIHDLDMNIINANDSAVEVFGYSKNELLKKSIFDLHTEDELDHSAEVLNEMKRKKKLSVETSFKRKDGSVFIAEATPCKYMLGDKPIIHVFIQDITERKQVLKKLQEFNFELELEIAKRTEELNNKNKELEAFSYSVSHDLRAPLRVIAGYSEILKEDYRPYLNEDGERVVDIIIRNTIKMGQLIDDILQLAKLNKQNATLEDINMNEVFSSVYRDLT
jgi:PAS domain S-box-containing protein